MKIIDVNGNERDCESVKPDPEYPGFMKVSYKSKHRKGHKHKEWYPIDKFIEKNPDLKHLTKGAEKIKEELGVVTSSGNSFIKDEDKEWEKNEFSDFKLWISRGKGEGQVRNVVSNSKNKVTVDDKWKEKPDETSQYVLSNSLKQTITAMGNTLTHVGMGKDK